MSDTETPHINIGEIVDIAGNIEGEGFDWINETDIFRRDDTDLTLGDLEENVATINAESVFEDDWQIDAKSDFTLKTLKELLSFADQLCNRVLELDPIMERELRFKSGLQHLLEPYKELRKEAQF